MSNVNSLIQRAIGSVLLVTACSAPALSQTTCQPDAPPCPEISLSGPRFGATVLSDGIINRLRRERIDVSPMVTQFGWQFERAFKTGESGLTALNEWVVLVGGLEQGVVLPSVSWMVGLRTRGGLEFGVGPNLTPIGAALAAAAGVTFHSGSLNVPVTFAVVPSKSGTRYSVLTGFNTRRQ